jgi:hypothetical protein
VSLTVDAASPRKSGSVDEPKTSAPITSASFAETLRDFAELDEKQLRRFSRLNALLRADRPAYPDLVGCRSWLAW